MIYLECEESAKSGTSMSDRHGIPFLKGILLFDSEKCSHNSWLQNSVKRSNSISKCYSSGIRSTKSSVFSFMLWLRSSNGRMWWLRSKPTMFRCHWKEYSSSCSNLLERIFLLLTSTISLRLSGYSIKLLLCKSNPKYRVTSLIWVTLCFRMSS